MGNGKTRSDRKIKRVLIANRGEIAVRILSTCRRLGIETVLVVSEADRDSLPARLANQVLCIGGPRAADSYLNRTAILTAALKTDCDAVHPGYGFLAEDPELAMLCEQVGVTYIGPSVANLRLFGDKVASKMTAEAANVPVVRGSKPLHEVEEAIIAAETIGFPVLLKPVRGGGGKGMRTVLDASSLRQEFRSASGEAAAAFGCGDIYIEKWVPEARHVEVQIAGDTHGNVIHFGDRDCSIQRRHQKLIEEAPAPAVSADLRAKLRQAAVDLCLSTSYDSIGTVEFLVDSRTNEFYFLEVNPRIQVEHGVTELITHVDLVEIQLDLAEGAVLRYRQDDIQFDGVAIECRLNAESPMMAFRPSPGRITRWRPPGRADLRIDTHCFEGNPVPPYYDSLLGKVMCRGETRALAIAGLSTMLDGFEIEGIETTLALAGAIIRSDVFASAEYSTRWLDEQLASSSTAAQYLGLS